MANKISHITNLLNEIKEIDGYAADLQEMAKKIVRGELSTNLTLTGRDLSHKDKITIDAEGDMVKGIQESPFSLFSILRSGRTPEMTSTPEIEFNHSISESTALKILAILLDEKKARKTKLHKELERLGVRIR